MICMAVNAESASRLSCGFCAMEGAPAEGMAVTCNRLAGLVNQVHIQGQR